MLKNPILLQGKQLWSIHFDPLICSRITKDLRRSELQPLFETAHNRGWISKQEAETFIEDCPSLKLDSAWDTCKLWFSRLNPKEERDSLALAGWLTLYNLYKYKNFLRSIRPPYGGLKGTSTWNLKQMLIKATQIELLEDPNNKEANRHFLGILICELCSKDKTWSIDSESNPQSEWRNLTKELYGKEFYYHAPNQSEEMPWILTPSHGFLKERKWIQPSPENVINKTKELYKAFNFDKSITLASIKNSLDKYLHKTSQK